MRVFRSSLFWIPFIVTLLIVGVFFAWELDLLSFLPSLPRPSATQTDILFTIVLGLLLSFNAGLATWSMKMGTCPVGTKRATGVAGIIGAVTLLCPVCLVLPASLFGLGIILTFLAPFLPLLRLIALILLLATTWMLWPKR
ncbi:MAG TPA: hypothetical protein VHA78_01235 [Candidatus Peribacteraceae bacterium]|nr:hypothetical protein [Candidatus Peribacteraceae bacterium]